MKYALLALAFPWVSTLVFAGERPPEIDSYASAFHDMLHVAAESYLVCYTSIEKKTWSGAGEQLIIKATIVDAIRGPKRIGDRIEFRRVLDGKYGDISSMQGSLNFIRYDRDDSGETFSVDPQSVFGYTSAFHKQAISHKNGEQNAAEQPASRPAVTNK